jgi:hypothetical protein
LLGNILEKGEGLPLEKGAQFIIYRVWIKTYKKGRCSCIMSSNNILICPSYQWHQTVIHAISCPEMNDASVVSRHSKGLVDISLLVNIKDQKERRKKGHFRKFKGIWDDTNCDRVRFLSKFSCPLRPNHFFFLQETIPIFI